MPGSGACIPGCAARHLQELLRCSHILARIALTGHGAHMPVTVLAGSHLFSHSYSAAWNCCVTRGQRTTDLPCSCLTHAAAPGIESDLYASSSQYLKSESFFGFTVT